MIRRLFGRSSGLVYGVVVAAALAFAWGTIAAAQEPLMLPRAPVSAPAPAAEPAAGLDAFKMAIDDIERTYAVGGQAEEGLVALKRRLMPLRDQLHDRLAELDPRLRQVDQRIAQLGVPPESPGSEDATIAAERRRLAGQRGDIEGTLKQVKLLADRALDLDERIDQRRRELFANMLFARGASLFDAAFWNDLAESVPAELAGLAGMLSLWGTFARSNGGAGAAIAAAAVIVALGGAAWAVARWRRRRVHEPTPRRFDKAVAAMIVLGTSIVTMPGLIAGTVLVLRNLGLMPYPVVDIGLGLAAAALASGFGRGVARALFAPGAPARRIVVLTDREAESYASHLGWAARIFGVAVFLNVVHRALGSPVAPMVATGELLAFAVVAIMFHQLWHAARINLLVAGNAAAGAWRVGLRSVLWLIGIAVATALATGYVGFAVFLVVRALAATALGGAVVIVTVFIDALLTEHMSAETPIGRRIMAVSGLSPHVLDLIETLASATLRLIIIALAVLLVMSFSGIIAEDFLGIFRRSTSDFMIGGINLSPAAILTALTVLVAGGLVIRAAQRWLAVKFLPRTGLEAGLQNSILSLFGYAALIAVTAFSLGVLGIDLQKIALIAGALSVGIGFGLQAVVSNFVSGLILLADRSIRVGDWVVVKNEEGFVRRISIRATEIETFDRASVIIPNQEFITGVVKNWTHGNTVGRIIVKVRVAFDSDVVKVRELLEACAAGHPQVLRAPAPAVYLMGFGDIGIDFELRCLIGDIEQCFVVRNDLYMEVLREFRDAGIKIPAPIHEAGIPGVPRASQGVPTGV